MALKFLSASGTGSTADAVSAILYASAEGADVTNNSWGGEDYSQALHDAVAAADASGSLFVAAAGNSFTDTDTEPNYPSSLELPNVVSVGATDAFDRRAWFSNYGRRTVDLSAPGTSIYSTWPGGSYRYQDGTSMAAPHVSGAAALAKAAFPASTAVGLKALLLRTVDPKTALDAASSTGGRLNASSAVRCSTAPQVWIESPQSPLELLVGEPVAVAFLAARCGDPAGVSLTAEANGQPLALADRGDGLYTGSFTPTAGGPVTISASAAANGVTDTRSVSGTAIRNYPIAPDGSPLTVTTTAAGENATLVFDGLGRTADQPEGRQRHVRHVHLLLDDALDRQARRDDSRSADPNGDERRLRRHEDAARERHVHDPGRSAELRYGQRDAHAVRGPARRRRADHRRRHIGDRRHWPGPRPERSAHIRRRARAACQPRCGCRHDRQLDLLLPEPLDPEARRLQPLLTDPDGHERRLRRCEDAARGWYVHDPGRSAGNGPRRCDADALRRAARREHGGRPRRPFGERDDRSRPRPKCAAHLRRGRRAARQPQGERRHDRQLDLLLSEPLDPEARRLEPRHADADGHERRLHRHEDAACQRHVHDPRRPTEHGARQRHADALRRSARCPRDDLCGRRLGRRQRRPCAGPGRKAHVRGHPRTTRQPRVRAGSRSAARPAARRGSRSRSPTARRS